jgi:hypothetical protein
MNFSIFNQQRHQADGTQNTATSPMRKPLAANTAAGAKPGSSKLGVFHFKLFFIAVQQLYIAWLGSTQLFISNQLFSFRKLFVLIFFRCRC